MKQNFGKELPDSALRYVIEGLLPYTQANVKLAFKPGAFFADLEKISNKKFRTLQNTYYMAVRSGIVQIDTTGQISIDQSILDQLRPYKPKRLSGATLMIIFDIPEAERWKRQHMRLLLRQLKFTQIQKSVWQSVFDSRDYLKLEIKRLGLEQNIILYEAKKLE